MIRGITRRFIRWINRGRIQEIQEAEDRRLILSTLLMILKKVDRIEQRIGEPENVEGAAERLASAVDRRRNNG